MNPQESDIPPNDAPSLDNELDAFKQTWQSGRETDAIETHLARVSPKSRPQLLSKLLEVELLIRMERGDSPDISAYERRFPNQSERIQTALRKAAALVEVTLNVGTHPTQAVGATTPPPSADQADSDDATNKSDNGTEIGSFRVIERIGKGGMGVVYKAFDPRLKRLVAIKMMLAAEHAAPDELARFHLEAEAVAKLQHPNIVQVFEVGEQSGYPYIALEFVDGPNLMEFVQGEPQAPRFAAELLVNLSDAIHYAHLQSVIHRDLKPANVLLENVVGGSGDGSSVLDLRTGGANDDSGRTAAYAPHANAAVTAVAARAATQNIDSSAAPQGSGRFESATSSGFRPKVTDFGLAKQLDAQSQLTATGAIVGTPQYMAPEQAAGSDQGVGPLADVYSLGAILYYLVTGRAPFHGATPLETLLMVRNESPPAPTLLVPQLSRDLETICLKCLEKDPTRRYASAAELSGELGRFLRGEPILARPVGRVERTWRWCRRNPLVATLSFLCVALLVGGFLGVAWKWREAAANLGAAKRAEIQATQSERTARKERNAAVIARQNQQRQSSRLLFRRGLQLCDAGNEEEGLHWLVQSLDVSPNKPEDAIWRQVVRANLAGWAQRLLPIIQYYDSELRCSAITISPDGSMLVLGTLEGRVYRYDTATGKLLGKPTQMQIPKQGWSGVWDLAFHPSGKWLLAGAGVRDKNPAVSSGVVQRIDPKTGKLLGKQIRVPRSVGAISFSHDGDRYAVGWGYHQSGGIAVMAWQDDQVLLRPVQFDGSVWDTTFSRDGRYLAAYFKRGESHLIRLIDLDDESVVAESIATDDPNSVFHTPDGTFVKAAGLDQPVRFDLSLHDEHPDEPAYLPHVSSSDEQRSMVATTYGHAVLLRKAARSELNARSPQPLLARTAHDWHHFVAFDDVSRKAIVGSPQGPGFARVLDTQRRTAATPTLIHPGRILAVAIHPNGVCATGTRDVRIWDATSGKLKKGPLIHTNTVSVLAFSPDGRWLAAGDYSSLVRVWDVATGKLAGPVLPQRDIVTCLAFSPDGKRLIVGTASDWNHDPQARLWDLKKFVPIGPPLKHNSYVRHVEFSSDGSRFLTASTDARVRVWDATSVKQIGDDIPYSTALTTAIFTPDGKTVLTGSLTGKVSAWDADTGKAIQGAVVTGPGLVTALAASRDGHRFVVGYVDGSSRLFDAHVFQPLGPATHQGASIKKIAVSPDGSTWTTVLTDGTTRSWEGPKPMSGSTAQLSEFFQLATGLTVNSNQVSAKLTSAQWQQLVSSRDMVQRLNNRLPPPSDQSWHEARASSAEDNGFWLAARRHLQQLKPVRPTWMLHARRGRTFTEQGEMTAAQSEYDRASAAAGSESKRLDFWIRDRVLACRTTENWSAAAWYLDRLIKRHPTDRQLRAERLMIEQQRPK